MSYSMTSLAPDARIAASIASTICFATERVSTADVGDSSTPEGEPQGNEGQMSAQVGTFSVKQEQFDSEWDVKAEQDADRWVEIMDNALRSEEHTSELQSH